jgi:hypothetical protein
MQRLSFAPCALVGRVTPSPPTCCLYVQVRAGVPISCVSLPFTLLDTSSAPLLDLCAHHGIKVGTVTVTPGSLHSNSSRLG